MRDVGFDIRVVGLFTLAQAPWTFKFVWSPLMDRFSPGWWGRRRGWMAIAQVLLLALGLWLGGAGDHPDTPWVVLALSLAIAFAAASQDIAIDAYAVEVLRQEEQGVAVGARTALYRAAMMAAGGLAIYLAAQIGWAWVNVLLACLYLPMLVVTWKAPEPETPIVPPANLRDAVWLPFLEALSRHRALEILAFVVLYKLADNLSQSLLRPFLNDMGYGELDRGLILGTAGFVVTILGTFLGGVACNGIGLGNALWVFGFLQIFSNVGYVAITYLPGNRPLMYSAMAFELFTTGLGMGAFGVLLLRMTAKRFSATQYALFSSLFGLPRILGGPVTGFLVDAAGWRWFFVFTMVAGIPGLILLWRFVPLGVREPEFRVEPPGYREPLTLAQLVRRGAAGLTAGVVLTAPIVASLGAVKSMRVATGNGPGFVPGFLESLQALIVPRGVDDWIGIVGVVVVSGGLGLFAAAIAAARHGR